MSIVDTIFRVFEQHGHAAYFGEPVSQLEHALQTAYQAEQKGAPDYLIVAALLHDMQGGVMDAAEVQRFKRWEWWCEAMWLRRLDDAAKIPGLQVFGLEHYRSLLQALTRKGHRV